METTRRNLLGGGAAAAATLANSQVFGGWEPSERYPDPAIIALDPSFLKYRQFNAGIERLATGMRWSEGPVWFGDARCVLWSDIPNNRMMRWDEATGRTACSAILRTIPTATPATARDASSPASTMRGA
jgi:gluconolactonase